MLYNFRVIKTHDPIQWLDDLTQGHQQVKLIYLHRDPRDVAVSFYHHMSLKPAMRGVSFQDFYRDVIRDPARAPHGLWEDHVRGYLGARAARHILVLRYEDMIADLSEQIRRIAEFIGLKISESGVQDIADKTSFRSMKSDPTCNYSHFYKHDLFLRSGKIGSWKGFLTEQQSDELNKIQHDVLSMLKNKL